MPNPSFLPPINYSKSGYFIDDMEHGISLKMIDNNKLCGDGDFWKVMDRARREGLRDMLTDLGGLIEQNNTSKYRGVDGKFGMRRKDSTKIPVSANTAGLFFNPLPLKGATFKIKSIGLKVNFTGNITVYIASSEDPDNPIIINNVPAIAQKDTIKKLSEPIELAFTDEYRNPITYYIYYETQGEYYSKKFWCKPCTGKSAPWSKYFYSMGKITADNTDLDNMQTKISEYTSGLIVDFQISCNLLGFLCGLDNFQTDTFSKTFANAYKMYAIMKLIGYILKSDKINFYTLLSKEHLYGKRNHLRKEASQRLLWMSQNIPFDSTDCYSCNQNNMRVGSIRI